MIFLLFILVLYIIFCSLDKKYELVSKHENNNDKQFRKIINFSSAASLILTFLLIPAFEKYIKLINLNVEYVQAVCSIPFLLKSYIKEQITLNKSQIKENSKKKDVVLTYCYYCGGELDGSNICPSCGKELDI